jgi:hypothetical protein
MHCREIKKKIDERFSSILKEIETSINERAADLNELNTELEKWRTMKDLDLSKREARLLHFCKPDNV